MSCRRIEELDLPGFLEDPTGDEHRSFREHYPGCRECSAEIRVWTELHLELTAEAEPHPSPDDLLRLQDDPGSLPAEERVRLMGHLDSCAACLEEVRAMETFAPNFDAVAQGRPAIAAASSSSPEPPLVVGGPGSFASSEEPVDFEAELLREMAPPEAHEDDEHGPGSWLPRVARVVWTPAFAYAALLVITLPLVYLRQDVVVEPVRQAMAPPMAKRAQPVAPAAEPEAKAELAAPARDLMAAAKEESRGADERVLPRARVASKAVAPARPEGRALALAPPRAEPKLKALGYVDRGVAAEAEGYAAAEAVAVARLADPDVADPGVTVLRPIRRGDQLIVSVPIPPNLVDQPTFEIRVLAADGRELRQSVPGPGSGSSIRLSLPAAWLGAGQLQLELRNSSGFVQTFEMAAPAGAAEE